MTQEKRSSEDLEMPHWRRVETALEEHQGKKRQARRAFRGGPSRPADSAAAGAATLFVTETLARRTFEILESPRGGAPGAVYWFGFVYGERSCATTLIIPEEDNRADAILASAVANEDVFAAIVSASLVFLGEVRLRDEAGPTKEGRGRDVRFEGAFAIEMPASQPLEIEGWRVRRQIEGECRGIEAEEIHRHLRLIPGFKDLRVPGNPSPRVVTPPLTQSFRI